MVQNLYADKVFSRQPSALWSLDESLSGVTPVTMPSTIPLSAVLYVYPETSYAYNNFTAYYIGSDNTAANLAAAEHGIPMIYGSNSIKTLYDVPGNSTAPSMIFPGFGLFNEDGKYKSITFEAWLRINCSTRVPKKFIGPISSHDGIYVGGSFIYLKIGRQVESHYVGEWGRPMLLHFGMANNSAFVMINGEQVITIRLDPATTIFASKYDSTTGDDNDWIGIYSPDTLNPINVDTVSIYPYRVSIEDAKVRFIWGQSVASPEIGGTKDAALPVIIDYSFSQYANNYSYPEKGDWQNGFIDNFESKNFAMTTPEYKLPTLAFRETGKTVENWYEAQEALNTATTSLLDTEIIDNDVFFKLNDTTEWGIDTYISFSTFNAISDIVDAVYGVFEYSSLPASDEILFKIVANNGEYFSCYYDASETSVKYEFVSAGATTTFDGSQVAVNERFAAGIYIPDLLQNPTAVNKMNLFFSNRKSLSLFIGGSSTFTNLYTGKIYRFGFCNAKNYQKIITSFSDGLVNDAYSSGSDYDPGYNLLNHFANYTLFGLYTHNVFSLDIATYSYWQDYIPASILGKNIKNTSDELEYALDFIQFNIDCPPSELTTGANVNANTQVVRSYVYFSDLRKPEVTTSDLSRALIDLPTTKVVEPDSTWLTKIYEVIDGSIIYLPSNIDFTQLGINLQVEATVPGILRNKIKIRNVQVAGQALNKSEKTTIGTKFARNIHPYRISGSTTIYDNAKNPYAIYKGKTPYLYLTKNSGIQLLGSTFDGTRGLEIPINESAKRFFLVDILQFGFYYDKTFSSSPTEILRISFGGTDKYSVIVDGVGDNTKGIVYIKDIPNNTIFYELELFLNGVQDTMPSGGDNSPYYYVYHKNWNFITVKFDTGLNFGEQAGAIRITGPFVINNISQYQISEEEYANRVTPSLWSEINNRDGGAAETWTQTTSSTYEPVGARWNDIYSSDVFPALGRDAQRIYNTYFGTNKFTALETNIPIKTYEYKYTGYMTIDGVGKAGVLNQNKTIETIKRRSKKSRNKK